MLGRPGRPELRLSHLGSDVAQQVHSFVNRASAMSGVYMCSVLALGACCLNCCAQAVSGQDLGDERFGSALALMFYQ